MLGIIPVSYTHLMCHWRKEHNQIDEFIEMPNHKKLEQSNVQKEVKIVKVKQQKKTPEQPKKVTCQDVMDFMAEQFRKQREDIQRYHEELMKKWMNVARI